MRIPSRTPIICSLTIILVVACASGSTPLPPTATATNQALSTVTTVPTASVTPVPTMTAFPSPRVQPSPQPCTMTTYQQGVPVYDKPRPTANLNDTLPMGEAIYISAWRDEFVSSSVAHVWYKVRGGWVAKSSDIQLNGDCDDLPYSVPTPARPAEEIAIDFTVITSADLGRRSVLTATLPDEAGNTTHIIALDIHFPANDPGQFVRWVKVSITCDPADSALRWEEWRPTDITEAITPYYRCGDVHPTALTPERNPLFLRVVTPADGTVVNYSLRIIVEPYSP